MRLTGLVVILVSMLASSIGFAAPEKLSLVDKNAAFKAAGYSLKGKEWRSECGLDDDSISYSPGIIEEVRDINGDGLPDAIILEGGIGCYGNYGRGFSIVSKQTDSSWKMMTNNIGFVSFLKNKGVNGWPDIKISGPGLCDGVWQYDGRKYSYKCSKEQEPGGCSWIKDNTKICK